MEPMETEPRRRLPSGCSVGRVTNLLMAFHFLLIMITALVVVGVLGGLNFSLSTYPDFTNNSASCPLYATTCVSDCGVVYGSVSVCYFVEMTYGIIAFVCLAYFVVQIVRGVFQFNLWFTTIVDVVVIVFTGLLCFATAVTISVGLSITCDRIKGESCDVKIPFNADNKGGQFYTLMNAVQGAAWMCMLFIFLMFVVTILRLVIFIKRRKAGTPIDMDGTLLSDDFDDKPE